MARVWEVCTRRERRQLVGHSGCITRVALSADGSRAASASSDATVLLWDMTGRRVGAPLRPGDDPNRVWDELAGPDAALAYHRKCELTGSPARAVALLKPRLTAACAPTEEQVARWLRDLDSPRFGVREEAGRRLRRAGAAVEKPLRRALAARPSPEARRRLEELLRDMDGPERWRECRSVEVLENVGDGEARRLLERLAGGAPGAFLTRLAGEACVRMSRASGGR